MAVLQKEKMKVLLMIPINRSYVIMPSLGLGYIASAIRNKGHDVEILHGIKDKITPDKFKKFLKKRKFSFQILDHLQDFDQIS